MTKPIEFYLSRGFDRRTAEYFASGRRVIQSVTPHADFTLTLRFDNGEIRRLDAGEVLKPGTVFEPLMAWDIFSRVYLDENHAVAWDIDPTVDSNTVWNNKIDLSPDSCYLDSVPETGTN